MSQAQLSKTNLNCHSTKDKMNLSHSFQLLSVFRHAESFSFQKLVQKCVEVKSLTFVVVVTIREVSSYTVLAGFGATDTAPVHQILASVQSSVGTEHNKDELFGYICKP